MYFSFCRFSKLYNHYRSCPSHTPHHIPSHAFLFLIASSRHLSTPYGLFVILSALHPFDIQPCVRIKSPTARSAAPRTAAESRATWTVLHGTSSDEPSGILNAVFAVFLKSSTACSTAPRTAAESRATWTVLRGTSSDEPSGILNAVFAVVLNLSPSRALLPLGQLPSHVPPGQYCVVPMEKKAELFCCCVKVLRTEWLSGM